MSLRIPLTTATVALCVAIAACSTESTTPLAPDVSLAKSGAAPSGGGGGGGGGGSDTTQAPNPGIPPVAPTYTARITTMGVVPPGFYYGSPTDWGVGGYHFAAGSASSYKPANGPIVLGACVTVTFYDIPGDRFLTEMKTVSSSKCP